MCRQPIIPEKGYFRTQMWNSRLMCHDKCRPTFYWDTKPEEDTAQLPLFQGATDETKPKPS